MTVYLSPDRTAVAPGPRPTPAILGTTHPETLATRNAIATQLWSVRRAQDAVTVLRGVVRACIGTLGPDHPDTLIAAGNLAVCVFSAGQQESALPLLEDNLRARTRVLGPVHRLTLTALDALATAYRLLGELPTAMELSTAVTAHRIRLLGLTHPETVLSRTGLALVHADLGMLAAAERELVSLADDVTRSDALRRGPTLAIVLGHLASCLADQGLRRRAADVAAQAVEECGVRLGSGHVRTLALRGELAPILGRSR